MDIPDGCSYCGVRHCDLQSCGRCKESQKENRCSFCRQQSQDLYRCSRCKAAFYCSRNCQIQHWKAGHKQECKEPNCDPDIQSQSIVCYFCLTVANNLRKCSDWTKRHKYECQGARNKVGNKNALVHPAVERTAVEHERNTNNLDKGMPLIMETCPVCGISGQFKSCQGCLKQKYCSTKCQKVDWKKHKENCLKKNMKTETEDNRNDIAEPSTICSYCKEKDTSLSCSGCKAVYYCSKPCQKLDWIKHKLSCKSLKSKMKVKETLSIAACHELGLVTPEEHRGRNPNDGYSPVTEEKKRIFGTQLCTHCEKHKICVECPDCKSTLYCSTNCRDLDKMKHQSLCFFTQTNTCTPLHGMSNMIGMGLEGRYIIGNSPHHSKLIAENPLLIEDGANLNLIIERTVRARDKAVKKTLLKYPTHTLITRIREIPIEEMSMFGSNICRQPLVFLSYIRRFHRYRGRHNVYLQDSDRREIYVSFYLPNDDPTPHFRWSDIVPGNFIAILYPCIHFFVDKSVGLRVDKASNVTCFDVKD
ncbi:uncharacterized protein LOC111123834 [Crassostrea virginica]